MKLTIITVCFNNLAGLQLTLQSVPTDLPCELEHLIIDGGSTDGTPEFLTEAKFNHNVQWISEIDRGLYHAMNKGLARATGDYVWFLNSGDQALEPGLHHAVLELEKNSADLLYCNVLFSSEFGERVVGRRVSLSKFRSGMPICHQGVFYKTQLLRQSPYREDFRIISDWISTKWFFENHKNCTYKNFVVARYMLDGLSSKNHRKILQEICSYHKSNADRTLVLLTKGARFFLIAVLRALHLFNPLKKMQHALIKRTHSTHDGPKA